MTKTRQFFHGAGAELREGYDQASHLAIINLQTGAVSTSPGIADPAMQEAFPCWSADGKMLYFCRAKTLWGGKTPPRVEDLSKVMYDLMCVKYDVDKNELGSPETVLAAADTGLSIGEPKASPDGRYLLFCMATYGSFFPFQPGSDLYLMEIAEPQVPAAGVQQPAKRIVALLVEQFAVDRLQQQARRTTSEQAVLQLYRREGEREQSLFVLPQKDPSVL